MAAEPKQTGDRPIRQFDFDKICDVWPNATADRNPFDSVEWLDSVHAYLNQLRDAAANGRLPIDHYIVPICMLASIAAAELGVVRVLDFGGGLGVNYVNLRASLPSGVSLRYDIVDSRANQERWSTIFSDCNECRYFTELPQEKYDVVFASGTIQYIQDWAGVLAALNARCMRWVVLPRLPVTTGAAFIARQNVGFVSGPHAGASAGATPIWFLNRGDLLDVMTRDKFELVHDHFISEYNSHVAELVRPPGDATLRVMSFQRNS